jgi:hypothetical protein
MRADWLTRVDRTVVAVTGLTESDEKEFWMARTVDERLAALEAMRRTLYGYSDPPPRLQRHVEVFQRGES